MYKCDKNFKNHTEVNFTDNKNSEKNIPDGNTLWNKVELKQEGFNYILKQATVCLG